MIGIFQTTEGKMMPLGRLNEEEKESVKRAEDNIICAFYEKRK
jgi:hypothetical protein